MSTAAASAAQAFELRFQSLFDGGRGLSFPCDCAGHVDIDALPSGARNNYFAARALMGRDYSTPVVVPALVSH